MRIAQYAQLDKLEPRIRTVAHFTMSRRSRRQPEATEDELKDPYDVEADDEVDDELEVTRCVCHQDELDALSIDDAVVEALKEYEVKIDPGLFIQCDKCLVWQHGYCVGLFTNDDVPDKYWCEQCKPDLHQLVKVEGELIRTLYKPVNKDRAKLFETEEEAPAPPKQSRKRGGGTALPPPKRKRHYEDYDEQLQRALRESAKEVGMTETGDGNEEAPPAPLATLVKEETPAESNDGEDTDKLTKRPRKPRARPKKQKTPPVEAKPQQSPQFTRAELLSQLSRPRYVADALSIYELRKRIGAILEWLGRSQLELEEERLHKIELFNYKENDDLNDDLSAKVIGDFNDNLKLMESLTEQILLWEQKFGKYAP